MSDLLRTGTVDISRYLPEFLQKDGHFHAICTASSFEHEKIRLALLDLLDQFFVETATWGLDLWERVLALNTDYNDDYKVRRKRIIAKIQGMSMSTVEFMNRLVQAYGEGYVEEHNDKYYFSIYTTTTDVNEIKRMKEQIVYYKPAHLGVNFYLGYSWNGYINFDGKYTYGASSTLLED